jgi:hypothetical protein
MRENKGLKEKQCAEHFSSVLAHNFLLFQMELKSSQLCLQIHYSSRFP